MNKSPYFVKSLQDEHRRTTTFTQRKASLVPLSEAKGDESQLELTALPMKKTDLGVLPTNEANTTDIMAELKKMRYLQDMLAEGRAKREEALKKLSIGGGGAGVHKLKKGSKRGPGTSTQSNTIASSSPPRLLEPLNLSTVPSNSPTTNSSSPSNNAAPASITAASVFLKPQILAELEHHIYQELTRLNQITKENHLNNHNAREEINNNKEEGNDNSDQVSLLPVAPPSDAILRKYEWQPEWSLLNHVDEQQNEGNNSHPLDKKKVRRNYESESQKTARRIEGFGIDGATNPINVLNENPNDFYRSQRIRIFSSAAKIFADQFKTYRKLLLWILCEYDSYVSYCHEVLPKEGRALHEKKLTAQFQKMRETEQSEFQRKMLEKDAEIEELKAQVVKLESVTSNARRMIRERDEALEFKDKDLGEAAEGRVALLSRIARLEKELWHQKELSEEPERRIKALQRDLFDAQDKIGYFSRTIADSEDTAQRLRARLEQAEETLRERKQNEQQMATRAQYQSWKRREVELLELNAQISATNTKLTAQLEAAMTQIARGREAQMTPRPMWSLIDNHKSFPEAASSGQRVWLANEMLLQMTDEVCKLKSELQLLQGMYVPTQPTHFISTVGPLPLCLSEEQWLMHMPFIPKLGLDTRIPAFLKGVGKAINYKLDRDEVTGFCNLMWFEKELARSTVPWEGIVSQVMAKYCPMPTNMIQQHQEPSSMTNSKIISHQLQSISSAPISSAALHQMSATASSLHHQDVCYSLFYAMQWFQFDPYVKFTRETILGTIDESSMTTIFDAIKRLKIAFTDQAQISEEDATTSAGPSHSASGGKDKPNDYIADHEAESALLANSGPATTNLAVDPTMANKPQWITRTAANEVLLSVFPIFSNRKIKRLSDALVHSKTSSKNPNLINIPSLFTFDSNKKKRTPLITELILLKIEERSEVVKDYIAALNRCESATEAAKRYPNNSHRSTNVNISALEQKHIIPPSTSSTLVMANGAPTHQSPQQGMISPLSIARELWRCDPAIPKPHMDQLLCYYFDADIDLLTASAATSAIQGATSHSYVSNGSMVSREEMTATTNNSVSVDKTSSSASNEAFMTYSTNPEVAVDYLSLFEKITRRPAHRFSARKA